MKKNKSLYMILCAVMFLLFLLLTIAVKTVDVAPVGPNNSSVGLATINKAVFASFGENALWYEITEFFGKIAILVVVGFAALGLWQVVRRKSILKIDTDILILGLFYVLTVCAYVLFEVLVINHRPILVEGILEASYPSSHTMLVVGVMITAAMQFWHRIRGKCWRIVSTILCVLIAAITVIGRLLSGVHWFTDILGGVLLAACLIFLYCAFIPSAKK